MSEPCTAMVHLRILCSLNVLYVRRRLYWFLLYCMDAWAQLVSTNVSFMLIEQQLCQLGGGRIGIPSRNNTFTYCKIQIGLGTGGYWWFVDARGLSLRRWKAPWAPSCICCQWWPWATWATGKGIQWATSWNWSLISSDHTGPYSTVLN